METPHYKIYKRTLTERTKKALKEEGIYSIIYYYTIKLFIDTISYYHKRFKASRTFIFKGKAFNYFIHKFNTTWKSERTLEIPIIWEIVAKSKSQGMRILEVGNVLSHYFSIDHDVLDLYDKANGVINQDVVDYKPSNKYNLIVSISTLEHVGWNEKPKDPEKILRAIENLKINCLATGGKIMVTLPLGFNSEMDRYIKEGKINFMKQSYLKRVSKDNKWIEVGWVDIKDAKYNSPFPTANGVKK